MQTRWRWLAMAASLLFVPVALGLAEFGIEGMGVVTTRADEARATISPDGRHIVWEVSGREGGAGGHDLWQATLAGNRWIEPQPLPFDSAAAERDPLFSADGRWLYFASDRPGGHGGSDLYRVAFDGGQWGKPENLGSGVNSRGNERAPTLSLDGTALMFSSDRPGARGIDLFIAHWDGHGFGEPRPIAGIDSDADETDAAWIGDSRGIVFARNSGNGSRLLVASCHGGHYDNAMALALSFNDASGHPRGAVIDASKPGEMLLSGSARSPRAGGLDIYRMKTPMINGDSRCTNQ